MQEEVAKHTKKIYHAMTSPRHSLWEKIKEVAIEIFIIVFAVTLSIWLHSWSDHRHEQKETTEFLKGLKDDLAKDIRVLEENKNEIRRVDSGFNFIMTLKKTREIDTANDRLIMHYLTFALRVTHPNIGRYEGFKSSGKIGTIEDDSLKQYILAYYQQTIPNLNHGEDFVNSFQTKILELEIGKPDKTFMRDLAKTFQMQGFLQITASNMEGNIQDYGEAQRQAQKIISMIDQSVSHRQD